MSTEPYVAGPDDEPPDWFIAMMARRDSEVDFAVAEIIRAWAIGYPDKAKHAVQKATVRKEYPRLHRALERAVRAYREVNSEPPPRYGEKGEFPF